MSIEAAAMVAKRLRIFGLLQIVRFKDQNRRQAMYTKSGARIRRAERAIALGMPRREMAIDDTSDFIESRQKVIALTHPEMVERDRPVLRNK